MTDKDKYLEFWGYTLGTPEAEDAWKRKVELDSRCHPVDAPMVSIFNEGFYEHLADKPLHFSNKKDLRRYCREHDLTMDYVE